MEDEVTRKVKPCNHKKIEEMIPTRFIPFGVLWPVFQCRQCSKFFAYHANAYETIIHEVDPAVLKPLKKEV
jgi:hypothetical protein